ncbi:MAG: phospholipase [Paludibacteraceae bacterium]|nr:phospholipase [Paludibacteraceae bacterium]
MIPLLLFIALGLFILVAFELRARKKSGEIEQKQSSDVSNSDGECCGQHLVCERETLLQTNAHIDYYDDEELDALADIAPEQYTESQYQMLREVFNSLSEKDVPGWCRSIQLRRIQLPQDIREEALLIVRERRQRK